jgi:hypothetical protein
MDYNYTTDDNIDIDESENVYIGAPLVSPLKSYARELRTHASLFSSNNQDKQSLVNEYKHKLFQAADLIGEAAQLLEPKDSIVPAVQSDNWKRLALGEAVALAIVILAAIVFIIF